MTAAAPIRKARGARGFTLIELIIVISIILILTAVSVPVYRTHMVYARESVLKDDLASMRLAISQYTFDKVKAPQSLDDLVSTGYLKALPKDPFTGATDTWEAVSDDSIFQIEQTDGGIVDVHSGSKSVGTDGTSYNSW